MFPFLISNMFVCDLDVDVFICVHIDDLGVRDAVYGDSMYSEHI